MITKLILPSRYQKATYGDLWSTTINKLVDQINPEWEKIHLDPLHPTIIPELLIEKQHLQIWDANVLINRIENQIIFYRPQAINNDLAKLKALFELGLAYPSAIYPQVKYLNNLLDQDEINQAVRQLAEQTFLIKLGLPSKLIELIKSNNSNQDDLVARLASTLNISIDLLNHLNNSLII